MAHWHIIAKIIGAPVSAGVRCVKIIGAFSRTLLGVRDNPKVPVTLINQFQIHSYLDQGLKIKMTIH